MNIEADPNVVGPAESLRRQIQRLFRRSLHVRHVDAGSCNACESEIKLLTNPFYDVQRLGIFFTPSPRHADLLLVTGPVTRGMAGALRITYEATPDPRLVVAVGACACTGGIFGQSRLALGGVAEVLPVDVYIPGCPPSPLALIHGLLVAIGRAEAKPTRTQIRARGTALAAIAMPAPNPTVPDVSSRTSSVLPAERRNLPDIPPIVRYPNSAKPNEPLGRQGDREGPDESGGPASSEVRR